MVSGAKIHIKNSSPGDEIELCKVAASAFREADYHLPFGAVSGGPPGHESAAQHLSWINDCIYLKYEEDNEVKGGCIARTEGNNGFIIGVFVAENNMRQGVGSALLCKLFSKYPDIFCWKLETPDYLKRNHMFYEKNGFLSVSVSEIVPELGYGFRTYARVA